MMAWIKVHQNLRDHRKMLDAADALEIDPPHMIGLLVSFWLWALDNTPNGSLEGVSNRTIARAAQWNGNADDFAAILADSGFFDTDENGNLFIHDWYEYAGKLIDQRDVERERSRRRRDAELALKSATSNDRRSTAGRVEQTRVDSRVDIRDTPPYPPQGSDREPNLQEKRFAEFWKAYPKKVGKKAAETSWKKLKPNEDLFEQIMRAVDVAKRSQEWQRENGRYIPNPSTWINQGRWDDVLTPARTSTQSTPKTDTMSILAGIIAEEDGGDGF